MFKKIKYLDGDNAVAVLFDAKSGKKYIAEYGQQAYFGKKYTDNPDGTLGEMRFPDFIEDYLAKGGEIEPAITAEDQVVIEQREQVKQQNKELSQNALSILYAQIALIAEATGVEINQDFKKLKGVL